MIGAGLIGAFFMGLLLFLPGVRDPERMASGALPSRSTSA